MAQIYVYNYCFIIALKQYLHVFEQFWNKQYKKYYSSYPTHVEMNILK